MPRTKYGLFIPDQRLRVLDPSGREEPDELLEFLKSPGRDPFKEEDERDQAKRHEFDDDRWPVVDRFDFLSDSANLHRLCVTELGGVGKSIVLEEIEYLTRSIRPDHLVMRCNLSLIPQDPVGFLHSNSTSLLIKELKKLNIGIGHDSLSMEIENLYSFLQQQLLCGAFTLIVDGIDQLSDVDARTRMESLSDFLDWYPKVTCIIAGRPYSIQRVWENARLGQWNQNSALPLWKFCIIERFAVQRNEYRNPSQAERYLGAEKWSVATHLEANELSLPRTLNVLRRTSIHDAKHSRTASELYWLLIPNTVTESLINISQERDDFDLKTDQVMIVIGAIALIMMIINETPVTALTDINEMKKAIHQHGIMQRINEHLATNHSDKLNFNSLLNRLAEVGDSSLRFEGFQKTRGVVSFIEFSDATIRDFYAAWFAAKYLDGDWANPLAEQFEGWQSKNFYWTKEASFGEDYSRFWKLLCEMPRDLAGESSSDVSFARMLRSVFFGRKKLRSTESMYHAWPELLYRGRYLKSKHFTEIELKDATTRLQSDVWELVFPNEQTLDQSVDSLDPSDPIHALLIEFLSLYPSQLKRDLETENLGVVRRFESGFREFPTGEFRFGVLGEEIREIKTTFQLNAYQTTNEIYKLFDPLHWQAIKPGERSPGKFGYAKDYCPEADCPVVGVTWFDALFFSIWCGGWLPDETQWEGACRGKIGKLNEPHTLYYYGDNQNQNVETAGLKYYGWYRANSRDQTHPVGSFATRPAELNDRLDWLGHPYELYDVHGNVWEWCSDWHELNQTARLVRGGGFSNSGGSCSCSFRYDYDPATAYYDFGVRVARSHRRTS